MMKKITLLLAVILYGFTLNAQVTYFGDNFTGGDMTQWTTIDQDGDGNNFLPANAPWMSANGDCINSDSWTSALGALSPNNYLTTTAAIAMPTVANLTLKYRVGTFQSNGTFIGDRFSVYLSAANGDTAAIQAGTLIYTGLLSDLMVADQADGSASFADQEFDLSAYQGQTLFLTFRHHNTFDMNSVLFSNILVSSPFSDDIVVNEISSPATGTSGCQLGTETVTANITNNGNTPITAFDATYVVRNGITGATIDSITEPFTISSLTIGNSTDISFTTLTSDISATDTLYTVEVFASLPGDQDASSDSVNTIVASIANQAIPYATSFNIFNATNGIPDITAWGWSTLPSNFDGFIPTFLGTANNGALLIDGECALFIGQGESNWAFSPCINTVVGQSYRVSYQARTGTDQTGAGVPEVLEVGFGNDATVGAMTVIRQDSLNDNATFSEFVYDFVATDAVTTIGIHKVNSNFIIAIEEFLIDTLVSPTANINSASVDACTGDATLNFAFETGNTYSVDWGDGTTETVTASPAMHTYTATGVQNITITATNLAGSGMANSSVDNTLTAPDATFTINQSGITDVSVSFTASDVQSCNTYTWVFGEPGSTGATGSSTSYTYTAEGTYTVVLVVENTAGSNTTSQTVEISIPTSINEIDFANGISVFPNPANDVLNVSFELNNSQDVSIELVSIDGRIVSSVSSNNTNSVNEAINTSNLATGMYILNVTTDEGIFTSNVMVK